ncbi:hypothetical protein [Enterococcus ratti]|nr:hypothetical protein [Enterococcus ratti]
MSLAKEKLEPRFASHFIIFVARATGMRFAELLEWTWDRVDLKTGQISIDRAWGYQDKNDFVFYNVKEGTISNNAVNKNLKSY